ncbi:MAG: hypothetical protein ACLQJR_35885 [Stellaceae bacterium]
MTSSAISTAISAGTALMNKLASLNAANAASQTNSRLTLIGNDLQSQLNKKVAQLQQQAQDPVVTELTQQEKTLTAQLTTYQSVETQIGSNNSVLGDLSLQLSDLAVAAQSGDSSTFDQTLASAQGDVASLQVVSYTPGLQNDGIASLQYAGLGVQSSSSYDLSTAAGQAQALAAVQAAQAVVKQITITSSQNQEISASIQQTLQTQISGLTTQVGNLQQTELTDAQTQITKLEQQEQTEYHLIQLNFGDSTSAASVLTSLQTEQKLAAVQPGTTLGILDPTAGAPSLFVANLTTSTPTTSSSSSSNSSSSSSSASGSSSVPSTSTLGSILSTSA